MKKEKKLKAIKGLSLKTLSILIAVIATIISASLIACASFLNYKNHIVTETTQKYMRWENVASDVQSASDYLTSEVRSFVVVGDKKHMDNYFEESKVTKRRENALQVLKENLENSNVYAYVTTATNESMDLMHQEYYAMRLVYDAKHLSFTMPEEVQQVVISLEDAALTDHYKIERAIDLVFGQTYQDTKKIITLNIDKAVQALDIQMKDDVIKASDDLKNILLIQQIFIIINIVFLIVVILLIVFYFLKPLERAVISIEADEEIKEHSVKEFAVVAQAYNKSHVQNKSVKERLVYEAEHDKLTRLYNRTGYDSIYKRINLENAVYILVDADNFKEINDKYGHTIGDKVLVRIAKLLNKNFGNDVDSFVFRIGGDEFSILIENYPYDSDNLLVRKLERMNEDLGKKDGDLPEISLSIGVAHGKGADTTDTLFKKADKALYHVKKQGRHGVYVYKWD